MKVTSIICILFLFSCMGACVQEKSSQKITIEDLSYSDTIEFIMPADTLYSRDIFLTINHAIDYEYENVYFKILFEKEKEMKEEVRSFALSNNLGYWIGKCGGNSCLSKYLLYKAIPPGEQFAVKFIQYSRNETLSGVHSLSISSKILRTR